MRGCSTNEEKKGEIGKMFLRRRFDVCALSETKLNGKGEVMFGEVVGRVHEITKIIKNLKNSNSVGWDNIPTNTLKTNVMTLAPILSNLINKSLAQGLFPQSLKRAKFFLYLKVKIN